jgi:histone H3/H4
MKFRTGLDRFNKYAAKFDPATIQARLTQVREIALQRAQEAQIKYATIDELVRPILDKRGVTGPMRAVYLGYAKKLTRHLERVSGDAAVKLAEGLKAYYTTAFGADPDVIDAVTAVVAGAVVEGGGGGGP